jgi:hypothetical protein
MVAVAIDAVEPERLTCDGSSEHVAYSAGWVGRQVRVTLPVKPATGVNASE